MLTRLLAVSMIAGALLSAGGVAEAQRGARQSWNATRISGKSTQGQAIKAALRGAGYQMNGRFTAVQLRGAHDARVEVGRGLPGREGVVAVRENRGRYTVAPISMEGARTHAKNALRTQDAKFMSMNLTDRGGQNRVVAEYVFRSNGTGSRRAYVDANTLATRVNRPGRAQAR